MEEAPLGPRSPRSSDERTGPEGVSRRTWDRIGKVVLVSIVSTQGIDDAFTDLGWEPWKTVQILLGGWNQMHVDGLSTDEVEA